MYDLTDSADCPWETERVFGGRLIRRKYGFMYHYDVFICIIPDAVVDCLGSIFRLINSKVLSASYLEMRHEYYNGHGWMWSFLINQLAARFLGCVIISNLLHGILGILENAVKCSS